MEIDYDSINRFLSRMEILELGIILIVIVVALRFKVPVGVTLFGAGILTAVMYQIPAGALLQGYWDLVKSERFLSLTGVMVLITVMGALLKELGYLERLTDSCKRLKGGNRTAVAVLPFLIGLMPMPGGALLSAPLVDNVLDSRKYTAEFKTFANYWFRHLVEPVSPLYPGTILTEGVTGMPMVSVALLQMPVTITMAILGAVFISRRIERSDDVPKQNLVAIVGMLKTLWPILGAIVIYAVTGLNLVFCVLMALALLVVIARPTKAMMWPSVKKGLSYRLTLVVFGILSFQTALELSGAINSIPAFAKAYQLPPELLIVLICFLLGFLTGMVPAFIGMGYTLLASFLYTPVIQPGHILLAYVSGYVGMLASPTHLCLILSNQYFGASLGKTYRTMATSMVIVLVVIFLVSHSPWAGMFAK